MNFSISAMDSTQRDAHALRMDEMTRFDPKFVSWGAMAGRVGRISASQAAKAKFKDHALQVVGKRMPHQHGASRREFKALSAHGNPELATAMKVIYALGLRLQPALLPNAQKSCPSHPIAASRQEE